MSKLESSQKLFGQTSGTYLLAHSVGLMPVSVREAINNSFFDAWENEAQPWYRWIEGIDEFSRNIGSLLNADEKDLCPQVNLSSALTKIICALPERKGKNKIILTEDDFPSMGFVLQQMEFLGYELIYIPRGENILDLDVWDQYLSHDVNCVFLTHVQSNTGVQIPVSEITGLASKREIISVVDIAQSVEVIPIDLQKWSADFVIGSCVKWLCGGPGAGFMWGRPTLVEETSPVDVGWFSHQNPFEFDIHHFQYANGIKRFWGGTPSVLPYVVASNSANLINEIGLDNIRKHNNKLTSEIIDTIQKGKVKNSTPFENRGGTLIIDFGQEQETVLEKLQQNDIQYDVRANGVRVSPHVYNTVEEISQFLEVIND